MRRGPERGCVAIPTLKYLGEHPTITGDKQVAQVPSTKAASPPIQIDRWFRNGKHPDAAVFNQMCEQMNQAMVYRTKEVFGGVRMLGNGAGLPVTSAAGTRAYWRFAFHTSPYTHALLCRAVMYPQTTGYNSNAYAKIDIYSDASETTLVATEKFYYGTNPLQTGNIVGWQYLKFIDKYIDGLTANTHYYAVVSEVDYGLIQSLAVADLQSMTENYDGYLAQNYTAESKVTDLPRSLITEPMPTLWKRGGAKILTWTVDDQSSPRTITSATPTNLIDGSSTTYGSSIPGVTLKMTGKARLSQSTGVPIKMFVWGKSSTDGKGRVYLKDSSGTTICVITDGWSTGASAWQAVTGLLPASEAKYYLVYDDNGSTGTLSIGAVSIIEYE